MQVKFHLKQTFVLTSVVGLLSLTAAAAAAATQPMAPLTASTARAVRISCTPKSAPAVKVAARGRRRVTGAVRVVAGAKGLNVKAALGKVPSYVSQSFARSRQVTVQFCLQAPRGHAATIVRLQPSKLSLIVDKRGALSLTPSHGGHASRLRVGSVKRLIRVVLDASKHRATLYVDYQRQESVPAGAMGQTGVQIGSVTPIPRAPMPSPAKPPAPAVTLTGVTVTGGGSSVIPTPPASTGGSGSTPSGGDINDLAPWPGTPFSPSSVWNQPLPANAPLDPNSQAYVNEVVRQVNGDGPWMNTTSYSTPVYVVPIGQPTQHVTLDTYGPDLQQEFDAVPIPTGAVAASGTDEHMVVWQPSTNRMWEFWVMHKAADGWHAKWGGEMDNVSSNPGYFTHTGDSKNWGATATGLPLLGGLVTLADLQRGYIDHALAISLVETARQYWSWPAQRTDGGTFTSDITAVPEGTRLRLDPSLDIAGLHLPKIDQMLAQAAQKYGIIVRDKAGAVVFYGQDPISIPNPWPAAFSNKYPDQVLRQFPWSHLEALQTQQSCCWNH
jgi:hypothetical protein